MLPISITYLCLILLKTDNILCIILSEFLEILRVRIWSVLVNVPCAIQNNVCYAAVE